MAAFYKELCKTTSLKHNLSLRFFILAAFPTNPWRHILENQIEGNIETILGSNI
ncbi:hypothetical protein [Bartonella massiliensis]|uniref:hypothetical protein n=1 Tax=Bartonella massiliensis TaxID=929795 RepID=UPI00163C218F|nr:hypothetical protein [Bartonella massiliensis]